MADFTANENVLRLVTAEVEALHDVISTWIQGSISYDKDVFRREFSERLGDNFTNIQPAGKELTYQNLINAIEGMYGKNPAFQIRIRNVTLHVVLAASRTVIASYIEDQNGAQNSNPQNSRISTVVMRFSPERGMHPLWLHLHETAVPTNYTGIQIPDHKQALVSLATLPILCFDNDSNSLLFAVTAEVEAMHVAISSWVQGSVPQNADTFKREFSDRLGNEFVIIPPSGEGSLRSKIISSVEGMYGKNPSFQIVIRNVVLRAFSPEYRIVVATYVEVQKGSLSAGGAADNARVSTVVMSLPDSIDVSLSESAKLTSTCRTSSASEMQFNNDENRAIWLHLHETALSP